MYMISSLSRRTLPRITAAAAFQRTRPTTATVTALYDQPVLFSRRVFSSIDEEDRVRALNRDAIADILCAEYGLKMVESKRVLATVFDTITESVTNGQTVTIPGFGKFVSVNVRARAYNNPNNFDLPKILKPATRRVKFRPYKHFKDCVSKGKTDK